MLMGKAVLDLASPVVGRLWRGREREGQKGARESMHIAAC